MVLIDSVLCNGQVLPEERQGWSLDCPNCQENIKYTILNIVSGVDVFFYSDRCSDVLLREEDRELANRIESRKELLDSYSTIEKSLSITKNGQQFKLKNNVCCPKCGNQFPYKFPPDSDGRLYENKIIWIEGATLFRGAYEPSNKLAKVSL